MHKSSMVVRPPTFRRLFAGVALGAIVAQPALGQLRMTTWNVTDYASTVPTSRDAAFQTSIYGVPPAGAAYAGKPMAPDVFVGQEFESQAAVTNFLHLLNTAAGSPGDWAAAPFLDGPDTDSAFFYRTSKIDYVATTVIALGSTSTSNQPRNTERYDIRPKGYSAAAATLAIYSVHLKAQGGTNDEGRRLVEATNIRNNAQGIDTNGPGTALPAGYKFLVSGDMNAQTSSASFYQEFTASQANNTGRFFDPISTPGSWNNNATFHNIHTQEPSTQMDDRHDQILMGIAMLGGVGSGLGYIGNYPTAWNLATFADPNHSYRCWGNDGTTYNLPINTTNNAAVGNAIASALIVTVNGNGHLPVFCDMRVPAKLGATASIDFGTVNVNDPAQQTLSVSNAGNVALWTAAGIDTLSYSLAASSGFTAPAGGFTNAPGAAPDAQTISMDTSTPGVKSGTVTITTNDPDHPSFVVTLTGTVQTPPPPCNGDANNDGVVNSLDLGIVLSNFGASVPSGTQGDVNSDGVVNSLDLGVLLSNFGVNCN